MSFKLLVSSLPEGNVNGIKEELEDLFKAFGNVVNSTFYRNNYAVVEMDSEESSGNASKELNGKLFREKELSVEIFKSVTKQSQNIPVIKLAVTNVAATVNSDDIKDLFMKYGLVTECEITDGSGCVKVESTGDIRTAIKEMNGFVLDDMAIKVEADVTPVTPNVNATKKSPTKAANNKSGFKSTVIKKTYTNKPQRGRPPFGTRGRGQDRMPIVRQFYEDEDLSALSVPGQGYDYDDSYYGEMEMDGDFYPSELARPFGPGLGFRPSIHDPSFFPRRGRGGPPARILRAPGPQRLLGPRPPMPMGHDQSPGAFHGFRGRGMSPGRGAAPSYGRGGMRGSLIGRGMMRGRGVFRGGPNGRGFPPGSFYSPEEFYEDEMPQEYLNPGNEVPVRIPRYAPYDGVAPYSQSSNARGNGPPPYFGGYEEVPMEEEYYGDEYYEEHYEDEPIVPPPYLGSGGGYRTSSSQNFSNGQSPSFSRQPNKRGQMNAQQRQMQMERPPKKRPVAPGEAYPPPPLRPAGSFVPPKKKFKGKIPPPNLNHKKGMSQGAPGSKKKNANKNINGNSTPIGGGTMRGGRGGGGGRPQPIMQSRPMMTQVMNTAPAPRAPGGGGMPRFGMRPQMQQARKVQNINFSAPGLGGVNRPRMAAPKNNARAKMIDFTADIDIN